jgi:hypothetical protein
VVQDAERTQALKKAQRKPEARLSRMGLEWGSERRERTRDLPVEPGLDYRFTGLEVGERYAEC